MSSTLPISVNTLNAFTLKGKGGNPAGVVFNPPLLTDQQYTEIAKQVGFSETAFVSPIKKTSVNDPDFEVRFFTPVEEVDLCGHATIASFSHLLQNGTLQAGDYRQKTKAGILDINIQPEDADIWMTQTPPAFGPTLDKADIAKTLNLTTDDLHPSLPVQVVSTGLPDIFVPIKNREILNGIQPDFQAIKAKSIEHNVTGYHLFALDAAESSHTAQCRNFAPRYDINEEAATGSASGALAAYLVHHKVVQSQQANNIVFEQGYAPVYPGNSGTLEARPSLIKAKVDMDEALEIQRVQVGGKATPTGTKTVILPT